MLLHDFLFIDNTQQYLWCMSDIVRNVTIQDFNIYTIYMLLKVCEDS